MFFARESYAQALDHYDRAITLGRASAYSFAARCDSERLTDKLDTVANYGLGSKAAALADLATALRGYEKEADRAQADRVSAMIAAVRGVSA